MLIIARTAPHGDGSERLIKAACRGICLVNLEKKPLRSCLPQSVDGGGEKRARKTLAAMAWIDCKSQDFSLVAGASDDKQPLRRSLPVTARRGVKDSQARSPIVRARQRSNSWRSRRAWIAAMASASTAPAGRMAMVEDATLISASPPPWRLAALRQAGGGRADARSSSVSFASSASSASAAALGCKSGTHRFHSPSAPARGFSEMRRTASHGNGKIIGQQGRCLIGTDQERSVELAAFAIVKSGIEPVAPRIDGDGEGFAA